MNKDKKRRSILDADPAEITNASKHIMKEAKPAPKAPAKVVAEKVVAKEKRKFIYLDESVHREAKVKASQQGKTIKQFLSDLILNSK